MKKKVFFVGIHNKPGMKPLDTKTPSGKVIDAIAEALGCTVVKTNLHGTYFQPTEPNEIFFDAMLWHEVYNPGSNDIIVLLGKHVQKNFEAMGCCVVNMQHPAVCLYAGGKRKSYIETNTNILKKILCHTSQNKK